LNKPLSPEVQRRLRALYSYIRAMEVGDLESVATLLHEAEQDIALDRMFQEVDMHYQGQLAIQSDELTAAREQTAQLFLLEESKHREAEQNNVRQETIGPIHALSLPQERKHITPMTYQPIAPSGEQEIENRPQIRIPESKPCRKRSTRFLQMFAAVLLVGGLLVGFLVLFASREPGRSSVVGQSTLQTQPPGIFIAVAETTSSPSSMQLNFEVYGLRSANNTPIWHTSLVQATGKPGSVVIQSQVAYIQIGSDVFALQTGTGKLLWRKTLPFDSYGDNTLQVEGNTLIAGGQDAHGEATLYRINKQNGTILWHYQTGTNTAFAIDNGVVYTGQDEVTSTYTPNPGTLRFLVALNATNGNVLWSRDEIEPLGITVQNGMLYVQSIAADNTGSDKRYFLSAWTSSGTMLWSEAGPAQEPIVIEDGLLVIDTGNDLCAYQADNGHQVWCTHNPVATFGGPGSTPINFGASYTGYTAQNGVLYATYSLQTTYSSTSSSSATFLQALNIQTGTTIWSWKVGINYDHSTSRQNLQTPTILSQKDTGLNMGFPQPPLLSQKTLSLIASPGIFTYSLTDGKLLWQSTIKVAGYLVDFVGSAYIAP